MNIWRVQMEEVTGRVLGQPEPVTTPSAYSQHISFSTDGQQIIYGNAVSRMNLRRVAFDPVAEKVAGEPDWVIEGPAHAHTPDVSPDGRQVVYSSQGGSQEDIYVIRSDGSGPARQLLNDAYKDRGPRWSPDGRRIAFYSDRSGRYEIWVINEDGSNLQQVTHTSGWTIVIPVWSPDGKRLAYKHRLVNGYILDMTKPWSEQEPWGMPPVTDPDMKFTTYSWSPDGGGSRESTGSRRSLKASASSLSRLTAMRGCRTGSGRSG